MMERLDLIKDEEFFDNPIFKEEEQEFKRNELDSLSLIGLSLYASATNCYAPGILSVASIFDK